MYPGYKTKNKQETNTMTAKLANTFKLNQKLKAGTISWAQYHNELLKINESED